MSQRLVYVQSPRWCRATAERDGFDPYDLSRCSYCARKVGVNPVMLRTARTNDGEWWLVSEDCDLQTEEWRDFQRQADGTSGPTLLPIGPDCFRKHAEFAFAIFLSEADLLAGPDVLGHPRRKS